MFGIAILLLSSASLCGQPPGIERLPAPTPVSPPAAATPPPSTTMTPIYSSPDAHERVGWPQQVRKWAIPSDTGSYVGYQVGGGGFFHRCSDPPYPNEGTWGWDYRGRLLPRKIILGWSHGRLYQGGSGAYRTDGPTTNHGEKEQHH